MKYNMVKLKELCTVNQGLQIPISKRYKEPGENRYFYITVQFLKDNGENYYIENPPKSVTCTEDEILVVRTGNTGQVITGVAGCFHNNFFKVTPNEKIYFKYLYYALNNKKMHDAMLNAASGTTIPDLKHSSFYDLEIPLPEISIQKKIAKILDNICDKLKLNNEINNNLYEFSNSIFKKWFIQFEYPDFNGNLKESELGKIPEDWEIGYFDDSKLTSIIKSGVDKFEGTKKYVATADVTEKNITNYEEVSYNEKPSRANMTPRISSVWFAKMENSVKNILVDSYMKDILNNYIFSTGFMGVECINNSLYYIWNIINDDKFLQEKNSLSTGTLMAGISNSTIKNYKYLIPDQNTLHKFNEIQLNINKKIYNNSIQNEKLSQLRDTLLPKLMNGEIDLDNIEV